MKQIQIIDIFGQNRSQGTAHIYTYPQGRIVGNDLQYFMDPRTYFEGLNVQEIFRICCTNVGWWISIIKKNPNDSRNGYAMLSLCLGFNRPRNGAQVINILRNAFDYFVVKEQYVDTLAETWLQSIVIDTETCPATAFKLPSASAASPKSAAYRTYKSEKELALAMTYIAQKDYIKYSSVYLLDENVAKTNIAIAGYLGRLHNVTEEIRIRREFRIKASTDCTPSTDKAYEGEKIKLTFYKEGFNLETVDYIVGNPNNLAQVDSNKCEITLNSAQVANIKFSKCIHLQCYTESNQRIPIVTLAEESEKKYGFKIRTSNSNYSGDLIVPENLPKDAKCILECTHYEKETLPTDDLIKSNNSLSSRIVFKGKKISVTLRLFEKNYQIAEKISLKELEKLKNEGFYEAFGNKAFITLPAKGNTPTPPKPSAPNTFVKFLQFMGGIFCISIIVYILFALICVCIDKTPWPFPQENQQELTTPADSTFSNKTDEQDCTYNKNADNEETDQKYLKKEDTWNKDRLKSSKYKALLNALASGNIQEVIDIHDQTLGTLTSSQINGHWSKIIEALKEISDELDKKKLATNELKRICNNGTINLSELRSSLEKICNVSNSAITQPAESKETGTKVAPAKKENTIKKAPSSKGTGPTKTTGQNSGKLKMD